MLETLPGIFRGVFYDTILVCLHFFELVHVLQHMIKRLMAVICYPTACWLEDRKKWRTYSWMETKNSPGLIIKERRKQVLMRQLHSNLLGIEYNLIKTGWLQITWAFKDKSWGLHKTDYIRRMNRTFDIAEIFARKLNQHGWIRVQQDSFKIDLKTLPGAYCGKRRFSKSIR